ncbi:ankyrin-2-like [Phymastichus coffea]|uniref:ankyrin-2-like n=1 Tax=Phymastichus coffea TaxID=108790 RepID=UPI00273B0A76|nr:ankyrin-2-like [Phymastichus coffea]
MAADSDYRTLAHYCAGNFSKKEFSNKILDSLKDVNCPLPMDLPQNLNTLLGFTPLHLAIHFENLCDIKTLIKRRAKFTLKNGYGQTGLHYILHSYCEWSENIGRILREPIMLDARIKVILSAHSKYNISEDPSDEYGISHFHIACITNNVKAVSTFLNGGVSVNKAVNKNSKLLPGYTPLHIAARYCALKTAKVLLENGADVTLTDTNDMTALQLLIDRNIKIMKCLGAKDTAMYKKLKADILINEKIIKMIQDRNGANYIGMSSLQIACTMQEPSIANSLLSFSDVKYRVKRNSTMWQGYTALHFAAHFNIETVKLLVEKGADILAKDANSITAFDLCVENYKIQEIYDLIINEHKLRSLKFSNEKTNLCNFILAMLRKADFESFIDSTPNLNINIPFDSPVWSGYTLLHLITIFLKRDVTLKKFIENTDYYYPDKEKWKEATGEINIQANKKNVIETRNVEDESITEAKKGNEEIREKLEFDDVRLFFEKQKIIKVIKQESQGITAIHLAFYLDNMNLVSYLLRKQIKIENPVDKKGLSHLHLAVAYENIVLIKHLAAKVPRDINKSVKVGFQLSNTQHYSENILKTSYVYVPSCYAYKEVTKVFKVNAGSTALHIAVAKYNHLITELLINLGADIYARDEYNLTPIHLMMCLPEGFEGISHFRRILERIKGLRECVVESVGLSHLHVACWLGSKIVVENLLNQGTENIELEIIANDSLPFLKQLDKMRPFGLALTYNWFNVVELLIEKNAKISVNRLLRYSVDKAISQEYVDKLNNVSLRNRLKRETGLTLLHFACAALNIKAAKNALNQGIDVNAQTHKESPFWPGFTPLHVLATVIDPDQQQIYLLTILLLNHGVNVTLKNVDDETPVHLFYNTSRSTDNYLLNCVGSLHRDITTFLLKAQQDFNANPVNQLAISHLHIACKNNCDELVAEFLNNEVDLNIQINYLDFQHDGGCSPLHLALKNFSKNSVDLLMDRGADLHLVDSSGNTALHWLVDAIPIEPELVNRFIINRIDTDVMATNIYGKTPFEGLLHSKTIPAKMINTIMDLKHIHTNIYNRVTGEGYLAVAFSNLILNSQASGGVEINPIFNVMMSRDDIGEIGYMDRNAIHNIISQKGKTEVSYEPILQAYNNAIYRLTRIGCNIDHQDITGRTPLHIATQFRNADGLIALLDCGADVNVIDATRKSVLNYALEYEEYEVDKAVQCMWIFYAYLSQYCSYGFELSQMNVELYVKIVEICELNKRFEYKRPIVDEDIKNLKNWEIDSSLIKLSDLLKNKGLDAYAMRVSVRRDIDKIFQGNDLHKNMFKIFGLLVLKYKEARINYQIWCSLIKPAIKALQDLSSFSISVSCSTIVVSFLTVKELKNMIESVPKPKKPVKKTK